MPKTRKSLFAVFGIVGLLSVILLSALAIASSDSTAKPTKLGDVPGFRGGVQGYIDDDTILLWEAFQRETYIKQCMIEDGYNYTLDAAFPAGSLRAVADSIGALGNTDELSAVNSAADSESKQTNPDIDSLSPNRLDGYYLALYGETAADVAYVDSTGYFPAGRNDFAQGGCFGAAAALPRLTTRFIDDDVRAEKTIEMAKAAPCVTPTGVKLMDLEALDFAYARVYENASASNQMKRELESDLFACEDKLARENSAAGERAEVTVFNRHKKRLLEHAERYRVIEKRITNDDEFKQYLRTVVVELEDSWKDIDTPPANSG